MSGISAGVIGEIIKQGYSYVPDFFAGNNTLGDVFNFVRNNATVLSNIASATGLSEQQIRNAIDLYLGAMQYLQLTTATPVNASKPENR